MLQFTPQSPSPSLKRGRSDEAEDMGEKRQRVESISAADDDMNALFAQAAAAAARHIEESSSDPVENNVSAGQSGHEKSSGQRDDTTPESRLLARTLSLPMLESLVSLQFHTREIEIQSNRHSIGNPDPHHAYARALRRDYQNHSRARIRTGPSLCNLEVTV